MVTQRDGWCTFRIWCRHARAVHVAGDFNGWSVTATPMRQVRPGLWETTMWLAPGEYRFRYFAQSDMQPEGYWLTDYAAFGVVANRFSSWDSVLYVPLPGGPLPPARQRSPAPVSAEV